MDPTYIGSTMAVIYTLQSGLRLYGTTSGHTETSSIRQSPPVWNRSKGQQGGLTSMGHIAVLYIDPPSSVPVIIGLFDTLLFVLLQ